MCGTGEGARYCSIAVAPAKNEITPATSHAGRTVRSERERITATEDPRAIVAAIAQDGETKIAGSETTVATRIIRHSGGGEISSVDALSASGSARRLPR